MKNSKALAIFPFHVWAAIGYCLLFGCTIPQKGDSDMVRVLNMLDTAQFSYPFFDIDTLEGQILLPLRRCSPEWISDLLVFYPNGRFKDYYFMPPPDTIGKGYFKIETYVGTYFNIKKQKVMPLPYVSHSSYKKIGVCILQKDTLRPPNNRNVSLSREIWLNDAYFPWQDMMLLLPFPGFGDQKLSYISTSSGRSTELSLGINTLYPISSRSILSHAGFGEGDTGRICWQMQFKDSNRVKDVIVIGDTFQLMRTHDSFTTVE